MKYIVPALMYPSFFGMIGFAVYWTNSAFPLLALVAMPHWRTE